MVFVCHKYNTSFKQDIYTQTDVFSIYIIHTIRVMGSCTLRMIEQKVLYHCMLCIMTFDCLSFEIWRLFDAFNTHHKHKRETNNNIIIISNFSHFSFSYNSMFE